MNFTPVVYGQHVVELFILAETSSLIQKSHDFGHFHGGPPPLIFAQKKFCQTGTFSEVN